MRPDLICRDCRWKGELKVKCWRTTRLGNYFDKPRTARQTHLSKDGTHCMFYEKRKMKIKIIKFRGYNPEAFANIMIGSIHEVVRRVGTGYIIKGSNGADVLIMETEAEEI